MTWPRFWLLYTVTFAGVFVVAQTVALVRRAYGDTYSESGAPWLDAHPVAAALFAALLCWLYYHWRLTSVLGLDLNPTWRDLVPVAMGVLAELLVQSVRAVPR